MKNPNMNPNDEIEKNQYGNNLVFQQFFSVLSLGQKLFLFLPSFFAIHLHIARNLIKHVSLIINSDWTDPHMKGPTMNTSNMIVRRRITNSTMRP